MMPSEFWGSTYKELKIFVKANQERDKIKKKDIILIAEEFGDKLIKGMAWKNPKNKSLVRDVFKELFEDELNTNKEQSISEQIRNLRSRK